MGVIYRESQTWFDMAGNDSGTVLGDESDVMPELGKDFVELLVGSPLPLIYGAKSVTATVRKQVKV